MAEYGGLATSENAASRASHRVGAELSKLKKSVIEGTVELTTLGIIGSVAMLVVSSLCILTKLMYLSPVSALLMVYCFLGAFIMLLLEGIHHPLKAGSSFAARLTTIRIYVYQEIHALTTLTGRALAYIFFGSLMLVTSGSWLGAAVGAYLCFVGGAMLFVGVRSSAKLSAMSQGMSEAEITDKFDAYDRNGDGKLERNELMELCAELGTQLNTRELEAALNLLDVDRSGTVDKHEFIAWWAGKSWQRSLLSGGGLGTSSAPPVAQPVHDAVQLT